MKKILTILSMGVFALSASATIFTWSVAGKSFTTSDGSNARAKDYFVCAYYATDLDSVLAAIAERDFDTVASLSFSSGTTSITGAVSEKKTTSDLPSVSSLEIFSIAFDALTVADASNYILSSTILTDAYIAPDTPTNKGIFTADAYKDSTWTKVPEPATGALALAGLALLFKRRRA